MPIVPDLPRACCRPVLQPQHNYLFTCPITKAPLTEKVSTSARVLHRKEYMLRV
jgi:hypothetical protein